MMHDWAISARAVSKHFAQQKSNKLVIHQFIDETVRAPFAWLKRTPRPKPESRDYWALRDVSFEIPQGDCVALIGHNGAGKSVLLRVLGGVTRPTSGEADLCGRTGVVLEVGAGFNRELSAHDNIFFQGAIIGMRRREIERQYEDIVAFSGLEPFLEAPLKTFSNGMLVRLAFAIAAHLEPDILLMDEVLAVADADFQNLCVAKLRALTHEGRTILLASHDLDLLAQVCTRALWLEQGRVIEYGDFAPVAAHYRDRTTLPGPGLE